MQTATPNGAPAWARTASIADYAGTLDKENSTTEIPIPYAAIFYRELRYSLMGTAYSQEPDTIIHARNVATARFFAGIARMADRLRNNRLPSKADNLLNYWVEVQNIAVRATDSRADIRARCSAQYKALPGPTRQVFDDACAELLGDLFVRVWRIKGDDLANPPANTFWPGVNPGPAEYDLGGGAWFSERCHLVIEVVSPNEGKNLQDYFELVNAQLFRLGNRMLPIYVTFDWGVNVEDGFILDVDQLDFGSLGEA